MNIKIQTVYLKCCPYIMVIYELDVIHSNPIKCLDQGT